MCSNAHSRKAKLTFLRGKFRLEAAVIDFDEISIDEDQPFTQVDLCHAHNVDLEDIDTSPGFIEHHSYPHAWYENTVSTPTATNGGSNYGFCARFILRLPTQ